VAEEDIRIAPGCMALADPSFSGAAYHCQQAAEKLMKGFLVAAGTPFGKTHDLGELADLSSVAHPDRRALFDKTRRLTVWGVAYRYPSLEDVEEPLPERQDLEAAFATIGRLADALRRMFG
jgi:HEPN domain-containing protein